MSENLNFIEMQIKSELKSESSVFSRAAQKC